VVFGCSFFRFPVVFRCSDLHGSSDDPNGLEAPPWWFLVVSCSDLHGGFVVQISGGFWFRSPRQQLVFFGAKQQFGKVKNIIFKCGKIIQKYIYIE
jgi:hypothetical protein